MPAIFAFLGTRSTSNFQWYPIAERRHDITGEELTFELLPSFSWHDGEAITATDWRRTLRLDAYMGFPVAEYVESPESITIEDELTVSVVFDQPYNPGGAESAILDSFGVTTPASVFGAYLERFEDATTEAQREAVQSDLGEFNWTDPEPYASGPLVLEDVTTQGIRYTSYEDYPVQDIRRNLERRNDVDFTDVPEPGTYDYEHVFYQSGNTAEQAMLSGRIDGGTGVNIQRESETERFPERSEIRTNQLSYGISLLFNVVDHEHADAYRDVRVRKAFAHVIDMDGVAEQFFGDFGSHSPTYSGLTPTMEEQLFDQQFIDSLTTYDRDLEEAERLLRAAGFSKGSKWWQKPDGTELTVEFVGPSSVQYYNRGFQVAVSNLKDFGIDAELRSVEGTSFFSQTVPQMDYGMTRGYYSRSNALEAWRLSWIRFDGPEEEDYAAYLQEPFDSTVVEVPPIGDSDSDERIEIDVLDRFDRIRSETDPEAVTELSRELSWAFNQTVPRLPVSPTPSHWYLNHDEWWFLPEENPLGTVQPLVWALPQFGGMGPREQ
jgi:peptide/nickel transport system substrate-binding protein